MDRSLSVVRYSPEHKSVWDAFVRGSKNGTFLFYRDYMDYHADRFSDCSLLFMDDAGDLVAILPANVRDSQVASHGGLTFGGVISDHRMKMTLMMRVFESLRSHLASSGITRLLYKAIPHIYHRVPAEEDLYALYRLGATLVRRDLSSTIRLSQPLPFSKGRRYEIKVARKSGIEVRQSTDFAIFMAIEAAVLQTKYALTPVHTADEIASLAARFPEHIRLFGAYLDGAMIAGVITYENDVVVHAQYSSSSDAGKQLGALDLVFDFLIREYSPPRRYFDFGISTDQEGRYLNIGLIDNKQGFGARGIAYDFYALDLAAD